MKNDCCTVCGETPTLLEAFARRVMGPVSRSHAAKEASWIVDGDRPDLGLRDAKLLEILVCPLCKGPLVWRKEALELVCKADRLAFPVKDGIPVMLEEEARTLAPDEEP